VSEEPSQEAPSPPDPATHEVRDQHQDKKRSKRFADGSVPS